MEYSQNPVFLIKDGKTDYRIMIPENHTAAESLAAEELLIFFRKASGLTLNRITDVSVSVNDLSPYISLGENRLFRSFFPGEDLSGLGASGYMIRRAGRHVFICGGSDIGTLYGVYGFLNRQLGMQVYQRTALPALEEIALDKVTAGGLELRELDCRVKPDIPYRMGWRNYALDARLARGAGFNVSEDIFIPTGMQPWHNTFDFLPPAVYNNKDKPETYHPDWYAPGGKQLSYTANGNKRELGLMRREVFAAMKGFIEKSYRKGRYAGIIMFTQEDCGDWDESGGMAYFHSRYGAAAKAASLIYFINPVAKRLAAYMSRRHPGRSMEIVIFGYGPTEEAPACQKDGAYLPASEKVRLEGNVSVLYAPITADFTVPLSHINNARYMETLKKWNAVSPGINFWLYSQYYYNVLMFYDNIGSIAENLRIAKALNLRLLFNETNLNKGSVGFAGLKDYMVSRLQWDSSLDGEVLVDEWFNNYFKSAAPRMRAIFDALRAHYAGMLAEGGFTVNTMHLHPDAREFWPEQEVDRFLARYEGALEVAGTLRESDLPAYYDVCERIRCESMMFRYLKIAHYRDSMDKEEYWEMRDGFFTDCRRYGIVNIGYTYLIREDQP